MRLAIVLLISASFVVLALVAIEGGRLVAMRARLRSDQAARSALAAQLVQYAALRAQASDGTTAEPLDYRAIAVVSEHLAAAGARPAEIESITVIDTPTRTAGADGRTDVRALRIALRRIPMPVLGRFAAGMHDDARAWRAETVRLSRSRLRTDANACMFDVDLTYRPTRRRSDDHGQ
jgi:hypothetical protein